MHVAGEWRVGGAEVKVSPSGNKKLTKDINNADLPDSVDAAQSVP
jgi:hypothetical protein